MLLSGIIFVSLNYQSKRKTMFKKTDSNPQLDMFTAPSVQLCSRASKKYSDPNEIGRASCRERVSEAV